MARRFSKGPYTVKFNRRRGWWEIHNGHRDPIAVVYTNEADARLMAASLKLLGSLKHMIAIVRMHEDDLRASERAKYETARALVHEVEGDAP